MEFDTLTEQEQEAIGLQFVQVFRLKEAKEGKKSYTPKRYVTEWGNKTALGIARTAYGILKQHWKA